MKNDAMSINENTSTPQCVSTEVSTGTAEIDSSDGLNFSELWIISSFNNGGCIVFSEFIPWNNTDSLVSVEMENLARLLKDLVFLPIMLLFGCPANLINMLVFYKQGLKERINVCLFALSLADELYLVNNILTFGEQLQLQFTTKEVYGPVNTFMARNHLLFGHGFIWVSQAMSAIIAGERCFCIMYPLRSKTVLQTSSMAVMVIMVYVVIISLTFILMTRINLACAYNPLTGNIFTTVTAHEFFMRNSELVIYLDVFVFGVGLPGLVIITVTSTTVLTMRKLHKAANWRAGTSSSSGLSQKELGLTKMLVANSIFFISCVSPFVVFRFFFLFMPEMSLGRRQQNFFVMIQWLLICFSSTNSSFNFVIYYTMGSRFRQTFWQLFNSPRSHKTAHR